MTFYPFHKELQHFSEASKFSLGNFGLWYNKMIPNMGQAKEYAWCVCDHKTNKDNRTEFYKDTYQNIIKNNNLIKLLETRHNAQMHYMKCMEQQNFHCLTFVGILKSPLITGLGESHPSETSIILDHNLGIPYMPASGIKGAIRYSHSKQLLFDEDGNFTDNFVKNDETLDETNKNTNIPLFFGGNAKNNSNNSMDTFKGSIIFLDAYPVSLPEIKMDIINPHYREYYGDENKPPGDYQDPKPVKFLTIAPETKFIFRFILDPESAKHKKQFKTSVKDVLEFEGVGAKTAIGYGRFKLLDSIPKKMKNFFEEYLNDILPPEEKKRLEINKFIERVNKIDHASINTTNQNIFSSLFSEWRNHDKKFIKNDINIAKSFELKVRKRKSNGEFTKDYKTICKIMGKQPEEKPLQETPPPFSQSKNQEDPEVEKKLKNIIAKGFCDKKNKNKILEKYKQEYPALCSKIKSLPKKKQKPKKKK